MSRLACLVGLVLIASPALGQEAGQSLEVLTRLQLSQGPLGKVDETIADEQVTKVQLDVLRRRGEQVDGRVVVKGAEPTFYRGRLHDLVWQCTPRLLAPLALQLREQRTGTTTVVMNVAGQPIPIRLQIDPLKSQRGTALSITGEGQAKIGQTEVTLRVEVQGRVLYLPHGESSSELRLRWVATGGEGADAESRVRFQTKVRLVAKKEESK